MKFKCIKGAKEQVDVLQRDYESAAKFGILSLGNSHLFFRKFFKTYYVSYSDLNAAFRRVYMMNGKKNSVAMEYLVLVSEGMEIATIGLPGTAKAREIIEIIKEKAPHIDTVYKGEAV